MNILYKYEKKIWVHLYLFGFLENTCFVCNSYGKWACWGCNYLYFEALKGLLLKNAPKFFSDFCRKCHATILEHWSHWVLIFKSRKSAFSMWLNDSGELITHMLNVIASGITRGYGTHRARSSNSIPIFWNWHFVRGYCISNLKSAYFVHYLKNINTF